MSVLTVEKGQKLEHDNNNDEGQCHDNNNNSNEPIAENIVDSAASSSSSTSSHDAAPSTANNPKTAQHSDDDEDSSSSSFAKEGVVAVDVQKLRKRAEYDENPKLYFNEDTSDSDCDEPSQCNPHHKKRPEEHRGNGNSQLLTVVLMANNVLGAGQLSLPTAFYQTSFVFGIILLLITTATTILTCVFIIDSATAANEFRFAFLAKQHLGKAFAYVVLVSLVFWPFGSCVAYAKIFLDYGPVVAQNFGASTDNFVSGEICWSIIGAGLVFLISCRRRLGNSMLIPSFVGLAAIFTTAVAVGIRAGDGSYDEGGKFFPISNNNNNTESTPNQELDEEIEPFYAQTALFKALPVFVFALNLHSNCAHYYERIDCVDKFPNVKVQTARERKSPEKMYYTLGYAHIIIIALYLYFGITGLFTFGRSPSLMDKVNGNILNGYSSDDLLMNIIRICYLVVILISYPIMLTAARKGINQIVRPGRVEAIPFWIVAVETLCLIVVSFILAGVIDSLSVILAVLGSIFGVIVMYISPSFLYLNTCCSEEYLQQADKAKNEDHADYVERWTRYSVWKKYSAYFCIGFGVVIPGLIGLLTTFDAF